MLEGQHSLKISAPQLFRFGGESKLTDLETELFESMVNQRLMAKIKGCFHQGNIRWHQGNTLAHRKPSLAPTIQTLLRQRLVAVYFMLLMTMFVEQPRLYLGFYICTELINIFPCDHRISLKVANNWGWLVSFSAGSQSISCNLAKINSN